MKLNPHLSFGGQCEAAFKFYAECLGGDLGMLTWGESPIADQAPPDWGDKILHATLAIGEDRLTGADVPGPDNEPPRGFSVLLNLEDTAEADRIFQALADGGDVRMPLQETFWAERFGDVLVTSSISLGYPGRSTVRNRMRMKRNNEVIRMKRMSLIVFSLAILAFASNAYAQTDAEIIERALSAAPAQAREGATVIKWNDDYSYETLKEGTNQMVCYDRSGEAFQRPFAVQCTSLGNLPRVAQSREFADQAGNNEELQAIHRAAEEAGTRIAPEFGSVYISRNGNDAANTRSHTTVSVPGATGDSLGLPENPNQGGAWVMQAGSSYAHIMIPGV